MQYEDKRKSPEIFRDFIFSAIKKCTYFFFPPDFLAAAFFLGAAFFTAFLAAFFLVAMIFVNLMVSK